MEREHGNGMSRVDYQVSMVMFRDSWEAMMVDREGEKYIETTSRCDVFPFGEMCGMNLIGHGKKRLCSEDHGATGFGYKFCVQHWL